MEMMSQSAGNGRFGSQILASVVLWSVFVVRFVQTNHFERDLGHMQVNSRAWKTTTSEPNGYHLTSDDDNGETLTESRNKITMKSVEQEACTGGEGDSPSVYVKIRNQFHGMLTPRPRSSSYSHEGVLVVK